MSTRRDRLPIRSDASHRTVFTHYRGLGGRLPPGPGRHYDKRHFAIQERVGAILMFTILAVVLFWFGVELGLIPDIFDWHGPWRGPG